MSWVLDIFGSDTVDPCGYGFIILDPRGHGVVKTMR